MIERPIDFSQTEMRAALASGRTQLRRPMKRQPPPGAIARLIEGSITANVLTPGRPDGRGGQLLPLTHGSEHCPFGRDGDHLWVRERWKVLRDGGTPDAENDTDCTIQYACDGATQTFATGKQLIAASTRWRPARQLPRWAARLVYEVLEVDVQRLHELTDADAAAEGADPMAYRVPRARDAFRYQWEESGGGPWGDNPWVWVAHLRCVSRA